MSGAQFVFLFSCLIQLICMGQSEELNSSRLIQLDNCTCLGYNQTFECAVIGAGITVWQGTAFSCTNNEIQLRHSKYNNPGAIGEFNDGAILASSVGVSGDICTSQLSVTFGQEMINKTIECVYRNATGYDTIVDNMTLVITEAPYPPLSGVHVEIIKLDQLVFAWNETTTQCSSLRYVITATNCGVCPNTTTDTNITCVLMNTTDNPSTCTFAVRTEICGDLVGDRSENITVALGNNGPEVNPPQFKLKFHYPSSKNATVEIAFTDEAIFEGRDSPPISYTITYSNAPSGRVCGSATIPASSCLSGVCCHTFGEVSPSCSPSGDVSISVFATSILGDGPSSQPLIFSLKTFSNSCILGYCYSSQNLELELLFLYTGNNIIGYTHLFVMIIVLNFIIITVTC